MKHVFRLLSHLVMTTLCFFWFLHNSIANPVQPGITLHTEQQSVFLGDTVIIDVESIGLTEPLDIGALFKDADLLRETTGTRIAVIDGKVVEVLIRHMEFVPKREGRIFFGPLKGDTIQGETVSNTLVVEVQPPVDVQWQPEADDLQARIMLTVNGIEYDAESVSTKRGLPSVYVGQQIIVDMQLRHRHPISEENIQLPSFDGFSLYKQHEERRTIETGADKDSMRLTAWRFHIFAERSGQINIDSLKWSGTAIRSRTQRAPFERILPVIELQIKQGIDPTSWWLPSRNVELADNWSKDPRELKAGDEILRIITLTAQNVLAHQLPVVEPLESRAISSTLIKHERTQQLVDDNIMSTAVFTFRMIAQSPIPVFLDTVRVPWFDVSEQQPKEAIIPARRINIGLPDRADLLNAVSMSDQWWKRYLIALRGHSASLYIWYFTLPLLLTLILLMLFKHWQLRRKITWSVKHLNQNVVLPTI